MSASEGIRFRDGSVIDFLGTGWNIAVDEANDQVTFEHSDSNTQFSLKEDGGFEVPAGFQFLSDIVFADTPWRIRGEDEEIIFQNDDSGAQFKYTGEGSFIPAEGFTFEDESVTFQDVEATESITDPTGEIHTARLLNETRLGEPDGVASLDDSGQVKEGQFPDLAINQVYVTNVEDGRFTVEDDKDISLQEGDVVVETYPDPSETHIFTGDDPSDSENWELIAFASESVTSVFGRKGDIEAQAGDYNPAQVGVEGEAVAVGAPAVDSTEDLPDPDEFPLGTRFFVRDENRSYEVKEEEE